MQGMQVQSLVGELRSHLQKDSWTATSELTHNRRSCTMQLGPHTATQIIKKKKKSCCSIWKPPAASWLSGVWSWGWSEMRRAERVLYTLDFEDCTEKIMPNILLVLLSWLHVEWINFGHIRWNIGLTNKFVSIFLSNLMEKNSSFFGQPSNNYLYIPGKTPSIWEGRRWSRRKLNVYREAYK